jgi:hypothetical protein
MLLRRDFSEGRGSGAMMILILALLKALLTLITFVAFAVISEQVMVRAPARVSTALYLCFVSLIPVMMVALELSWHSTRPFAALLQLGIAVFLILLTVLPAPPELIARIMRPAAGPTDKVAAARLTLPGTHIKRGETLITLAIIGCVLTAYFAKITDEIIPLLVMSIGVLAVLIANFVIHNRLRERARPSRVAMDLTLSDRTIHRVGESDILAWAESENCYGILSPIEDQMTYIQCAKQEEQMYHLEYQDGSPDKHYRAADEQITLDRVQSAFGKFLRGDASWRTDFRWEKMDLEAVVTGQTQVSAANNQRAIGSGAAPTF